MTRCRLRITIPTTNSFLNLQVFFNFHNIFHSIFSTTSSSLAETKTFSPSTLSTDWVTGISNPSWILEGVQVEGIPSHKESSERGISKGKVEFFKNNSSSLSGDSSCHSCCRLTSVSSGIMLYNSFSSVSYLTQQICSQVFIKISQEFPQIQYHSNSHRTQLLRLASFGSLEPQSRTCKEMGSIQRGGLKYMNRIQLILIFI